jgi:hypothetical protein
VAGAHSCGHDLMASEGLAEATAPTAFVGHNAGLAIDAGEDDRAIRSWSCPPRLQATYSPGGGSVSF